MTDAEYTKKLNILKTHMLTMKLEGKDHNVLHKYFIDAMKDDNVERKVAERMWSQADDFTDLRLKITLKNHII